MANIKISELPLAGTISGGELIPIVQDGTTKQTTLSSVNGIPSTAKAYLPDFDSIFNDIVYIANNEPVGATDSVWQNWTAPLVFNAEDFSPGVSALLFNKGIYEENDYNDGFSDIRNIGYSGVINFGVFEGPGTPAKYSGGFYYFDAGFTDDTYSSIGDFVDISIQAEVEISYSYDGSDPADIVHEIYIQNFPLALGTALSLKVVVDNTGVEPSATYTLQTLGNIV